MRAILIGCSGTGKSTFINHFRQPQGAVCPTIGVDCFKFKELNVWDTSGACRFQAIVETFYDKMDIVIIVYVDIKSFSKVEEYRCRVHKKNKSFKGIIVYNGNNENARHQGEMYSMMYNFAFFQCDCMNSVESHWVLNRINEMHKKPYVNKRGCCI